MPKIDMIVPDELRALKDELPRRYERGRKKHLVKAMDKAVMIAYRAIRPLVPVGVTGEAQRSIGTRVIQTQSSVVGKVSSSMRRPNVYLYVQNAGRKPGQGKAPRVEQLVRWVKEKGIAVDDKAAQRVAYVIARSIKRKGTSPQRFFWRGWDQVKGQIDQLLAQAVENLTEELGKHA
jgi:hypothetical protein